MQRQLKLKVSKDLCGNTIKQILYKHYNMSTSFIKDLKANKAILLNEENVFVNTVVKSGDILTILIPIEKSKNIIPTPMNLDIIYEDSDLLIVNKPYNIPVHPCESSYYNTLANGIVYHWKQLNQSYMFRPVNRLDKGTSGLVVVAKSKYVHQQLSCQIKNIKLKRKYLAIVHGYIKDNEATINLPIARKKGSILERIVNNNGKSAQTHYKVKQKINGFTLTELSLKTGRTHQIRVHMSYIGYPLVGDWLYGNSDNTLISRPALHSYYIEFIHPITKELMHFESKLPDDMKKLIKK